MKDLFKKLLDDLSSKDVLSEEKKAELEVLFETKLKDYKEQIYTEALSAIDKDHGELLEKVLDKIDSEHLELLEDVIDQLEFKATETLNNTTARLDEDATEGIQKVIDKYETQISEDLNAKVGDFLDVYLEDVAPDNIVVNNIRLEKLEEMFAELKKITVISEISMDEEIKEAVLDAKLTIESKEEEINQLMLEKITANNKLKNIEAKNLLEEKCKNINPKMRAYIETRFADNNVEEIEDEFDEAVKAFVEDEQLLRENLRIKTTSTVNPVKILTEGVVDNKTKHENPIMDDYVNRYVRSKKYNTK